MKPITKSPHVYSRLFSVTSLLLSILILVAAIVSIPSPKTDMDFFYLFASIFGVAVLSLASMYSTKVVLGDSASKTVRVLCTIVIALNIILLLLDAILFILVGLVGATSSY